MSVLTKKVMPVGVQHPADGPLQVIEYAIQELVGVGNAQFPGHHDQFQSEIIARGNRMSNDPTLVAAIAAAVTNRAVLPGESGTKNITV